MAFDPEESLRRIERGELPLSAKERLEELAASRTHPFTSTLSPPEQALARLSGYHPIAQVMGSCFFHVGLQWNPAWGAGELDTIAEALVEVRRRALERLRAEARILGAHLVIGVRVKVGGSEHSGSVLEFSCNGTAVRVDGEPVPEQPGISLLDADQVHKARRAGFWPVDVVLGCSVALDPHCDCYRDGSWSNNALVAHTRLCEGVEQSALRRFEQDAARVGCDGVVGVSVHRSHHEHHEDGHTRFRYELLVMGTAVRRVPKLTDGKPPVVLMDLGRDAHRRQRTPR